LGLGVAFVPSHVPGLIVPTVDHMDDMDDMQM
jgi:hypothetical protein